jgi:hypothetical protein
MTTPVTGSVGWDELWRKNLECYALRATAVARPLALGRCNPQNRGQARVRHDVLWVPVLSLSVPRPHNIVRDDANQRCS